jgi:hypothetical protein
MRGWHIIPAILVMSACALPTPVVPAYSAPDASGLIAVQAYPTPRDVCQIIGESEATQDYLDHTTTLIGCPAIEPGAIEDRLNEGAMRLTQVGAWVLLSVPN